MAGQSSGAQLIKTLLSTPAADSLFQRAILQSAPLDFGDHTPQTSEAVGQFFLATSQCTGKGLACLQNASVSSILDASSQTFVTVPQQIPGVAAVEPFRPVVDGKLVAKPFLSLVKNGKFTNTKREIMFTTVKNEAGPQTYAVTSGESVAPEDYELFVNYLVDPTRAQAVLSSGLYKPDTSIEEGPRNTLELLGTDWVWRWCVSPQDNMLT